MLIQNTSFEDLRVATDRIRADRLAAGQLSTAGRPFIRRTLARKVRRSH